MMECQHCQVSLADYLDNALPPGQRAEVEQHLSSCPACRLHLDFEGRLDAYLSGQPGKTPPAGFAGRVLARARQEGLLAPPSSWLVPALAYVASLVVLLLGLYRFLDLLPWRAWTLFSEETARMLSWGKALAGALPDVSGLAEKLPLAPRLQGTDLLGTAAVVALLIATWALYASSDEELV